MVENGLAALRRMLINADHGMKADPPCAAPDERAPFQRVVEAGIGELGAYLEHEGII